MTTTTTSFVSSTLLFDPNPTYTSLNKTRNAFNHCNHQETVYHATDALTKLQNQQLIYLLDMSAHAYGMQSKFNKATECAKEIITYEPSWSMGYIRYGSLLEMQGFYVEAIKIYGEALEKVSQDNPYYPELEQRKKVAAEKNELCVDYIAILPLEVVGYIFEQVPEIDKSICFNVSSIWRQRMIANGATVWKTIENDNSKYSSMLWPTIATTLPYIAQDVQNLTINGRQTNVWLRYLEYMENGRFKKIKYLKITGTTSYSNIDKANTLMSLISAIWNLRNTLTTLDIKIPEAYNEDQLLLSDLLFYCPKLKKLVVDADYVIENFIGDMDVIGEQRYALVDLDFRCGFTSGSTLVKFLKFYPNIQRLAIDHSGTRADILTAINEHCHHLKLFGHVSKHISTLEELLIKEKYDYDGPSSGVREIITRSNCAGVPAEPFLRILRNNAKSLQRLNANMSMTYEQMDGEDDVTHYFVRPLYPSWKFERLEYISYHPDIYNSTELPFLQSIEFCTTLKHFAVENSSNVQAVVDTLVKMPLLETFTMSNTTNAHNGEVALEQLFKTYAQRLSTSSSSNRKLHTISFRYCNFITKRVLDAIVGLDSISVIKFSGTCSFQSQEDLKVFLQKMSPRLVEVSFFDITLVDDTVVAGAIEDAFYLPLR
ncbi:hypothetical protein BDA99DRAFT_605165 [Phascolomyces articulosus]|uniref:F-box domain-containing protein n=1 Tax=Phascolomyces articulosus TaxID=60185 RepID=A0AAD5JZX6_9FUNG|nr:hypothetical protein BDA99DRAFT_605165 [Phascolomyces articulosus]